MLIVFTVLTLLSVAAVVFFFRNNPQQAVVLVPLMLSVIGPIWGVYTAIRSGKDKKQTEKGRPRKSKGKGKDFRVAASFQSGFLGGLIGGGLAGLISGILGYLSARHPQSSEFDAATWADVLYTFSFACLTGAVFGSFSQFLILVARHLFPKFVLSDVIGGVLGGGLGGLMMGLWAALVFGQRKLPQADVRLIFAGGILCAICVVLGILLYDHKERGRTVKRTLYVLLPVLIIVVTIGAVVLIVGKFSFETNDQTLQLQRGTALGGIIGALWGLVLGGTLALYRINFKEGAAPKSG